MKCATPKAAVNRRRGEKTQRWTSCEKAAIRDGNGLHRSRDPIQGLGVYGNNM